MLSFFRVNAVYQVVSLIVLLALIRLPFLFHPLPLLIPELQWMLVGEKLGNGVIMYRDVWDNLSPLSAVAYWGLDVLFGRSQLALQVAASLVTLFQAIYFNYLSNEQQLFPERNYVPGLIYVLFINMSFDCSTLSPVLMATTFVLLAFGTLIKQISREGPTEEVFEIGFYLSLATLFYLPASVLIFWALLSMLLYTGASFRQLALMVFGFVLPLALTALIFFFRDSLDDLNRNLLASVFQARQYDLNDFTSLITSLLLPLGLGLLGFFRTISYGRFVNFQSRCHQIMMLWFLIATISLVLTPYLAPMQFILMLPPAVFFTTNLFLLWRRRPYLGELAFLAVFATMIFIQTQSVLELIPGWQFSTLDTLRVKPSSLPASIKNERILVVGDNVADYRNNIPATPYLNWDLARYDLQNVDTYERIISVFDNFMVDPPTFVIDQANVMPQIFESLPELSKLYRKTKWKGIYERV